MAKILKCSRGRANDPLRLCAVVGVFLMLAISLGGFLPSSVDIDGAGGGSYRVAYHHSNGTSNGEYFDISVKVTQTDTKEGYLFMGWTDVEGSDVVKYEIGDYIYESDMSGDELDLYPVFIEAPVGSGSGTFDDPYIGFAQVNLFTLFMGHGRYPGGM